MAGTSALSLNVESAGRDVISRSEILDLLTVVSLPSSDASTTSFSSCDTSQPSTGKEERKKRKKKRSFRLSIGKKVDRAKEKQTTFLRKLINKSKRQTSFKSFVASKKDNLNTNGSLAIGTLDTPMSCRSPSLVSIPETEPLNEPLPKFVKIETRKRLSKRLSERISKLFSARSPKSSKALASEDPSRTKTKKRKSFSKGISKMFSHRRSTKERSDDSVVEIAVVPQVQALSGTVSFSKIVGTMPARVPQVITATTKAVTDELKAKDQATTISMAAESTTAKPEVATPPPQALCDSPPSLRKKIFNYKKRSSEPGIIDLPKSILRELEQEDVPMLVAADTEQVDPIPTLKASPKKRYLRRNPVYNLLILGFFLLATYMMSSNTSILHVQPKIVAPPPSKASRRNSNDRFLVFSDFYSNYYKASY